jgi:hypothetical protein
LKVQRAVDEMIKAVETMEAKERHPSSSSLWCSSGKERSITMQFWYIPSHCISFSPVAKARSAKSWSARTEKKNMLRRLIEKNVPAQVANACICHSESFCVMFNELAKELNSQLTMAKKNNQIVLC